MHGQASSFYFGFIFPPPLTLLPLLLFVVVVVFVMCDAANLLIASSLGLLFAVLARVPPQHRKEFMVACTFSNVAAIPLVMIEVGPSQGPENEDCVWGKGARPTLAHPYTLNLGQSPTHSRVCSTTVCVILVDNFQVLCGQKQLEDEEECFARGATFIFLYIFAFSAFFWTIGFLIIRSLGVSLCFAGLE